MARVKQAKRDKGYAIRKRQSFAARYECRRVPSAPPVREWRENATEQIQLTEEAARRHETHCEVCGSTDYYVYSPMGEGPEMWQRFRCNDCDTTWTEVFLLYLIEVEEES